MGDEEISLKVMKIGKDEWKGIGYKWLQNGKNQLYIGNMGFFSNSNSKYIIYILYNFLRK